MKTRLSTRIALLLLLCMGLASCLKDSEKTTGVSDCYISSITLGNLKRAVTVPVWVDSLQAYKDSTYLATYNGSYYRLAINQLTGNISNPDSLLYNTRLGNALVTINAMGTVTYRPENQMEEQWSAYSSTDSIDISGPVLLRVYSLDGTGRYRDYRLTLNVRQEDPEAFVWTRKTLEDIEGLAIGNDIELTAPYQFVAAYDTLVYALADGKMWHAGPSLAWEEDLCDAPEMLPTDEVVGIAYDMPTGGGRVMMLGVHGEDTLATVWGKTIMKGVQTQWVHYPWRLENHNPLPALSHMSVIRYNGDLVAIGGSLEAAYVSPDNGVTWKRNYHNWSLPEGLDPTQTTSFTTDNQGCVWLINGNDVYRGHIPPQK